MNTTWLGIRYSSRFSIGLAPDERSTGAAGTPLPMAPHPTSHWLGTEPSGPRADGRARPWRTRVPTTSFPASRTQALDDMHRPTGAAAGLGPSRLGGQRGSRAA